MDDASFTCAPHGLARFPPNIEQVTVESESGRVWLTARRNDTVLRFPLDRETADHLTFLLRRERVALYGASPTGA
jgi:hypothetical protein